MTIIGHGIDAVDVARIAAMIEKHGERFIERCFTPGEQAYAESSKRRIEHYAARFAAKEAILKCIGTGWSQGVAWTDAEIVREPSGKPTVALHGVAAKIANTQGITRWTVSLTHTSQMAFASAIAESE